MADQTWTEFEVYCERMGWDPDETDKARVERNSPKRYRAGRWDSLIHNPNVWKRCGVCGLKFVVNNWADHKPRTPKLANVIVCMDCDPRHVEDRYLKENYRLVHHGKLRIFRMSQIVKSMATHPCMKKGKKKCKCPACTARKVINL